VSTWLLGIAANVLKHHFRSKARRRRFERNLSLAQGDAREARVAERIEAKRSLAVAHDALQKLDLEKRRAFVLCELEGLSAREAAQTLGATETTVWKRVSETRKLLRRAMPVESV
jgi:RNA polymerase sigma-70 factor (ECF subfamily)